MSTIAALTWTALTQVANLIRPANVFLTRLLFPEQVHVTYSTEEYELGVLTGNRKMAPFVRKGAEAVLVSGTGNKIMKVAGTNIRIKQALTPTPLFFDRQPGTRILLGPGESQIPEIEQVMAREIAYMSSQADNSIEYLVSMMLQGVISYEQVDGEVFTITIPRSAANNIVPSEFWDNGAGAPNANAVPLTNIVAVKRVIADAACPAVTDAICGSEATDMLLRMVETGAIKMLGQQGLQVSAGQMTFVSQFQDDGALFLGELGGVRFWSYGRTAELNGTDVNMIRPKYIEFVSNSLASRREMMYAAISDMRALQGGSIKSRRFAKSWDQEDPSVRFNLLHTRPLPWPYLPDATVSFKAISG